MIQTVINIFFSNYLLNITIIFSNNVIQISQIQTLYFTILC